MVKRHNEKERQRDSEKSRGERGERKVPVGRWMVGVSSLCLISFRVREATEQGKWKESGTMGDGRRKADKKKSEDGVRNNKGKTWPLRKDQSADVAVPCVRCDARNQGVGRAAIGDETRNNVMRTLPGRRGRRNKQGKEEM